VGLSLAGERVVLVSDPAVAADVMIRRAHLFVKEGTAFFPGSSLAGEGLLVSDGDVWVGLVALPGVRLSRWSIPAVINYIKLPSQTAKQKE
jgi:hypothetical protein